MKTPLLSALALAGLFSPVFAQEGIEPLLPVKDEPAPASPSQPPAVALPRIAVVDTTVTVEGVSRPDLGQSLSDTIAACLIESKQFEVIDFVPGDKSRGLPVIAASSGSLPLIAPDGSSVAAASGPDYLVVPTIVGEKGFFRLTLRKQHARSGRIETVLRESVKGDTAALYKLVETTAAKLIPPRGYIRRYDYVKMWLSPASTEVPAPPAAAAPRAIPVNLPPEKLAAMEAAKLQGERLSALTSEPERAGVVHSVSSQWSFAVISGLRNAGVKTGDLLMTWSDRTPGQVHTLKVNAINGSAVVVDVPESAVILPGDKVYRWKQPVEIRPAE